MIIRHLPDDSGLMAVVDPDAYPSFVRKRWDYDELVAHFVRAMSNRQLLIWATGSENRWNVEIGVALVKRTGFRSIEGGIAATRGRLHVLSYDSLTMAASYSNVTLPENIYRENVLAVTPGTYVCRVVQIVEPESDEAEDESAIHFAIELTASAQLPAPWTRIPWETSMDARNLIHKATLLLDRRRDFDAAEKTLREACDAASRENDRITEVQARVFLAELLADRDRRAEAEELFKRVIAESKQLTSDVLSAVSSELSRAREFLSR